jgi:hypothetical protein
MLFFADLFRTMPCESQNKAEVEKLVEELRQIAIKDDFLSEHPGGVFNMQCKHVRARQIGTRMDEIGGVELMEWAFGHLRRKLTKKERYKLLEHLGYCWNNLNGWKY